MRVVFRSVKNINLPTSSVIIITVSIIATEKKKFRASLAGLSKASSFPERVCAARTISSPRNRARRSRSGASHAARREWIRAGAEYYELTPMPPPRGRLVPNMKPLFWLMLLLPLSCSHVFVDARDFSGNRGHRYTIDELLNTRFPNRISGDWDLDICKAGGFLGDIALPNIKYETEWREQELNKSFYDEFEKYRDEVLKEGLQVEEEGLTEILQFKSENDSSMKKAKETKKQSNPEPIAIERDQYKFDTVATRKEDKIPEVKDYGYVFSLDENPPGKSPNKNSDYPQFPERKASHKRIPYPGTTTIDNKSKKTKTAATKVSDVTTLASADFSEKIYYSENYSTLTPQIRKRRHHRRKTASKREHEQRDQNGNRQPHQKGKNKAISSGKAKDKSSHSEDNKGGKNKNNKDEYQRQQWLELSGSASLVRLSHFLDFYDRYGSTLAREPGTMTQRTRRRRAATARKERVWDHGVIPYEIDGNFSGAHKALFKQAMRHWENFTCVKFVERVPREHPNYIVFTERPCGCCSFVGKRGNGPQAISIGKNCDKFGIVVHELGHVVGFWHEHTRPDRDRHVQIIRDNIMTGQEYNFNKLTEDEVNSLGLSYDYDSIMHYAKNTFSKGTYLDTILPMEIHGKKRPEIGQRVRLSEGDIAQTNLLYRCHKCGRTFQENSGSFGSPSHPNSSPSSDTERCEWRITANHGERILLNITYLDIYKSDFCRSDYLEIRDGYWHKSHVLGRFCGNGQMPAPVMSMGSRMLVTYVASARQSGHGGFTASYEAVCGGDVKVDGLGHLESPNYPEEYQSSKECVWRLTAPQDYQVALKFQSFEIESHDNCVYDYVEVRDGHSADSALIGVYCGYKLPTDVRSSGNKLLVKFVSDSTVQKAGFSATFMKEFDECALTDHGCEHECINTLGGYACACKVNYELHSDGKHCEDACGGTFESNNGTITSPSFPETYPNNKHCVWEIIAPVQYRITLNFTHFDLEGNNVYEQPCEYDWVEVASKLSDDVHKKHGIFCGSRPPPLITSEGNSLKVVFSSDNNIKKNDFSSNKGVTRPTGRTKLSKNKYYIHIFKVFDMEPHQKCAYDHIAIYDGESPESQPLGRFCGNKEPHPILATGNQLFMVFKSDATVQKQGFYAQHMTACGGHLTATDRVRYFYSHARYGSQDYDHRMDCDWTIEAPPGKNVHLNFLSFNLEDETDCSYDWVEVHSGLDTSSPSYGRLCGSSNTTDIISINEALLVRFRTDDTIAKSGFAATYYAYNRPESEELIGGEDEDELDSSRI
ncbi:tolloid-like protein 2 [Copidosoma floridanum]|uniref:tolloid-like protein 2 n=1 Tax=Copidosoma floridanum TaxID=29053 RepID=UPI000C6F67CC|nr:tolloid-like protein 2 [Copidosoma floridanum]